MHRLGHSFISLIQVPALVISSRTIIAAKGVVENRIIKHYTNRTVEQSKAEREASIDAARHPNPMSRKEELSHLTHQCSYEYVPEFQRWANDMMAVYNDPQGYGQDMAYHYHRIWKAKSPTCRGIEDGSGACEICRVHPHS
ncbi:unnamed protein product [Phytomonas sp. EM1]|nr:unnamed protein product [Phytomonas sp. EM1]|eukprot:CCW59991.1 unnamed protein product [Phytomonas sp. isolate EM1]